MEVKEIKIREKIFTIIMILALIPVFISCDSAPRLAEDSFELERLVKTDMTIDQLYNLMAPTLEKNSIIYPAQNIFERPDGKWQFTAKEGGRPGDINAPYQVLVIYPVSAEEGFFMLFFKDKKLIDSGRFDYETGTAIEKLLWTTESTD